jgi:flagellar hook-associated protein 3 FlgL
MRISSRTMQLQWLTAFQRQQAAVAESQRQISSGRRIETAGDDPATAAQSVRLDAALARIAGFAQNGVTAQRRLALEEDSLDKVTTALDRARELMVQSGSGVQNAENRRAIAVEVEEILRGVLATANAQDGEGRFLFGGSVVKQAPFTGSGGSVAYQGDSVVRGQRIAEQQQVAEGDPGSRVFMDIRAGNGTFSVAASPANAGTAYFAGSAVTDRSQWVPDTYTVEFTAPDAWEARASNGDVVASGSYAPGSPVAFRGITASIEGEPAAGDRFTIGPSANQSIFRTLQDFIDGLAVDTGQPAGRALFQSRLNAGLQDIDQALGNISLVRSEVGARLSAIEAQQDTGADLQLELTRSLSGLRDVDYAAAVSALEQQLTALEAAQKAFARSRAFSLFDVL